MEFVAIDVETANADMASICQIGIAQFKGGTLAQEWKTYVDPQDHFDGINVSIHGIDEDVVAGSPTFAMLADTLISRLSGRIIVTHTAFDRVAVHQASTKHKTPPLSCTWLDTACVARRAWTEFSRRGYGLASICASLGFQLSVITSTVLRGENASVAVQQLSKDVNDMFALRVSNKEKE